MTDLKQIIEEVFEYGMIIRGRAADYINFNQKNIDPKVYRKIMEDGRLSSLKQYENLPPILTREIFEEILGSGGRCDCYEHKIMQYELVKKYNLENKDE